MGFYQMLFKQHYSMGTENLVAKLFAGLELIIKVIVGDRPWHFLQD
jgi:hypothetical protein